MKGVPAVYTACSTLEKCFLPFFRNPARQCSQAIVDRGKACFLWKLPSAAMPNLPQDTPSTQINILNLRAYILLCDGKYLPIPIIDIRRMLMGMRASAGGIHNPMFFVCGQSVHASRIRISPCHYAVFMRVWHKLSQHPSEVHRRDMRKLHVFGSRC